MNKSWAEPDVRDEVVDYVRYWSDKTGIKATKMIRWIKITRSKYYDWLNRYGKVNEHNAWIPRDFWLTDYEKQAIINYYHAKPRIISDNGPQFIAKDFKEFIRISGMTHVKTSPYYPQSNGKLERYHRTIKGNCIRVNTPLSLSDAQRLVTDFVDHYNNKRLHSAIGYITPKDKLEGRAETILAQRDAKLAAAREARKAKRKAS